MTTIVWLVSLGLYLYLQSVVGLTLPNESGVIVFFCIADMQHPKCSVCREKQILVLTLSRSVWVSDVLCTL